MVQPPLVAMGEQLSPEPSVPVRWHRLCLQHQALSARCCSTWGHGGPLGVSLVQGRCETRGFFPRLDRQTQATTLVHQIFGGYLRSRGESVASGARH